jgi:hypothetical protein
VEGCWTCRWWTLSGTTSIIYTSNSLLRMKNQKLPVQFRLLMMGGVSPETCWTSYKYGTIKVWYNVAFCWIFSLWIVLWCTDPRIGNDKDLKNSTVRTVVICSPYWILYVHQNNVMRRACGTYGRRTVYREACRKETTWKTWA